MAYNHETFIDNVQAHITHIADAVGTNDDGTPNEDRSTILTITPMLHLVGNLFSLAHAINENLNRIAVAQEEMVKISHADMAAHIDNEIAKGVEIKLAEKPKRDYIGK